MERGDWTTFEAAAQRIFISEINNLTACGKMRVEGFYSLPHIGPMAGRLGELVKAYLAELDIAAVTVEAVAGGQPARLTFSPRRNLDPHSTFWFVKRSHAELIVARCNDDFAELGAMHADGWINLPASDVAEKVALAARELGATCMSNADVAAQARAAVAGIVAQVEHSRQTGGLAKVNTAYKVYRQAALARGEKPVTYTQHLHAFTLSLVQLAARDVNAH